VPLKLNSEKTLASEAPRLSVGELLLFPRLISPLIGFLCARWRATGGCQRWSDWRAIGLPRLSVGCLATRSPFETGGDRSSVSFITFGLRLACYFKGTAQHPRLPIRRGAGADLRGLGLDPPVSERAQALARRWFDVMRVGDQRRAEFDESLCSVANVTVSIPCSRLWFW